MTQTANRKRLLVLAAAALIGSSALTGSLYARTPDAAASARQAQNALAKGKRDKAVAWAEQAVAVAPDNEGYRATLGSAYLNAGRFVSAAAAFGDAVALGDTSPRTMLSLALAQIGAGRLGEALAVLDSANDTIAPADLGLAYALAGDPQRGAAILTDAIRNGENTPKVRQNLAYTLAIGGDWRQARIMASMDIPAEKLGDRLAEWAATAQSGAFQHRVAALLQVPVIAKDPGRPEAFALTGTPAQQPPAADSGPAEAAYTAPAAPYRGGELPALAPVAAASAAPIKVIPAHYTPAPTAAQPDDFHAAFVADAPQGATPTAMIADSVRFVSQPVVQAIPARYRTSPAPLPAPQPTRRETPSATVAAAKRPSGNRLVQLGAFGSEQRARQASQIYLRQYRGLDPSQIRITQANVNGKTYWRVSAAGLSLADARAVCSTLKAQGQICLTNG